MQKKNKRNLVQRIHLKLNGSMSYQDIYNVVSILFEEIQQELINSGKIKIGNFATFTLKKFSTPMRRRSFFNNNVFFANPKYILKILLNKKFSKFLKKHVEVANQ